MANPLRPVPQRVLVFLYALIHAGRHLTEGDSMSLKEQITEDMKAAMRTKDSGRLATIRLLTAAIKQKEVDELPNNFD